VVIGLPTTTKVPTAILILAERKRRRPWVYQLPTNQCTETGLIDPTGNSSILPGSKDVNGPAGDNDLRENAVGGYLWDVALRAKLYVITASSSI
jgi:hypothetical protein